jgi:hypothetical protein
MDQPVSTDMLYFKLWMIHPDGHRKMLVHCSFDAGKPKQQALDCMKMDQDIWIAGLSMMGFNPDDFKFEIEETLEAPNAS